MGNEILVFGCGGHAKTVINILNKQGAWRVTHAVDKSPTFKTICGIPVLSDDEWENNNNLPNSGIVAIGDNYLRSLIVKKILKAQPSFRFISAIHPSAILADSVKVGNGTCIHAGATIEPDTVVGDHCIINTSSSINHDNHIKDYCNIGPNSATGGVVVIDTLSTLGVGVSVNNNIQIGKNCMIGSGSTIVNDFGDDSLVYGTPGKLIKKRKLGDSYL